MNYAYIDLSIKENLIEGVVLRKLVILRDETGSLVETLRSDWSDVFNFDDLNFTMQYMSVTPSGLARDEKVWHVHDHQKDRFICISGRIVTAIFDPRESSKTHGKLNLFVMGPENENEMYLVVIPEKTYHGFMAISKDPAYLLNFPTQLYNPDDEGRSPHKSELSWQKVRNDFKIA